MKKLHVALAALLLATMVIVSAVVVVFFSPKASESTRIYSYSIVNTYPHRTDAFTEGLVVEDDILYESTGLNGFSAVRKVGLENGTVLQEYPLSSYFGEGLTVVGDRIIQLTWQNYVGFVYDKSSFTFLRQFNLSTEGWGLTYNGAQLILSDGTSNLYFLDPNTFQTTGKISVHDGNTPVTNINELEYVNGDVYANIWMQQKIAVINPQTGQVKAWIDLTGIYQSNNPEYVLNGIAYDSKTGKLFVTGKCWPNLYEIKLSSTD